MTINDLETLKVVVSKEVPFNLTEKFDLIKVVNDIEEYYNKPLSRLSKTEVLNYVRNYILDDEILEDTLMEVFPEVKFE